LYLQQQSDANSESCQMCFFFFSFVLFEQY